jgi:O-antigen ligase
MMRDHPFGVGWNKAVETYEKNYSPPENGAAAITMNDYLMLGTQLGLPGLICFVAYVGLALKQKSEVRSQKSESLQQIGNRKSEIGNKTACRAGAVVLLVAFWFDGGLFTLATGSVFWILLELGAGVGTSRPAATGASTAGAMSLVALRKERRSAPSLPITDHERAHC